MEYQAYTTLNEIRELSPCRKGWEKLLAHLGKAKADDEPLHILTILESNGLDDALWCLRAKSLERLSRHFQAWCAERATASAVAWATASAAAWALVRAAAWAAARDTSSAAASAAAWAAASAAQEKQLRLMIGGEDV